MWLYNAIFLTSHNTPLWGFYSLEEEYHSGYIRGDVGEVLIVYRAHIGARMVVNSLSVSRYSYQAYDNE